MVGRTYCHFVKHEKESCVQGRACRNLVRTCQIGDVFGDMSDKAVGAFQDFLQFYDSSDSRF